MLFAGGAPSDRSSLRGGLRFVKCCLTNCPTLRPLSFMIKRLGGKGWMDGWKKEEEGVGFLSSPFSL